MTGSVRRCITLILVICLCALLFPAVSARADKKEYRTGPGTWMGYGIRSAGVDNHIYSARMTIGEDGLGTLTLSCEGVTMSYPFVRSGAIGYKLDREGITDDPLSFLSGGFKDLSFSYWDYQDEEHPGWLTLHGTYSSHILIRCLPMSEWEKPYREACVKDGVTIRPTLITDDEKFIRNEWLNHNYNHKHRLVRFELDQPKPLYYIDSDLRQNIFVRTKDGMLDEVSEIIYPGGLVSGNEYTYFDMLFIPTGEPEAVVCFDQAVSLDGVATEGEPIAPDMTEQGQIRQLYRRLEDGELKKLKGEPKVRGKLVIAQIHSSGIVSTSPYNMADRKKRFPDKTELDGIPYEMLAETVEEGDTFIFVVEKRKAYGTYTGGGQASSTDTLIYVVNPKKDGVYEEILVGTDKPPKTIRGHFGSGGAGEFKSMDAMQLILALYQKK